VRTGAAGAHGLSLVVVEKGTPGFTVSRRLAKMGWLCSDTAELSYADVRVPAANLVGVENTGFVQIAQNFVSERIGLAVQSYACAQRSLDLTVQWCRDRETFGRPLISRQPVQNTLAEMARRVEVARVYTRSLAARAAGGEEPWRAGIVHRLDRRTSGLLVVAKSEAVHRRLKDALRARAIEREYLALVEGRPPARSGTIDAPLGRDRRERRLVSNAPGRGPTAPRAARGVIRGSP